MGAEIDAFGLGMWFGATGPLAIHVVNKCFTESRAWIRFIISAAGVFGTWGVAGTFGAHWTDAYAFGLLLGAAIYGLCVWMYLRDARINEHKKPN
jgi:hypothetical protein